MPSGLSASMTLLNPKSVILASKLFMPDPSKMLPACTHKYTKFNYPIIGETLFFITWFQVKVNDGWFDFIEVLQSTHCLHDDCPSLGGGGGGGGRHE